MGGGSGVRGWVLEKSVGGGQGGVGRWVSADTFLPVIITSHECVFKEEWEVFVSLVLQRDRPFVTRPSRVYYCHVHRQHLPSM